mmetsp:Transcript_1891/g.4524  ORF Transcript_1891/g.4524 Transcript_1891/m.4524 type:complete len:211 (+) Transcript_1891:743-1375(+)
MEDSALAVVVPLVSLNTTRASSCGCFSTESSSPSCLDCASRVFVGGVVVSGGSSGCVGGFGDAVGMSLDGDDVVSISWSPPEPCDDIVGGDHCCSRCCSCCSMVVMVVDAFYRFFTNAFFSCSGLNGAVFSSAPLSTDLHKTHTRHGACCAIPFLDPDKRDRKDENFVSLRFSQNPNHSQPSTPLRNNNSNKSRSREEVPDTAGVYGSCR